MPADEPGNLRIGSMPADKLMDLRSCEEEGEAMKIYGLDLDENGRCRHYHKHCDVVALKCSACGKYYACYECHDTLEDHSFAATGEGENYPVLCGNCHRLLTRPEYLTGSCPHCGIEFNPRCKLHYGIYFS